MVEVVARVLLALLERMVDTDRDVGGLLLDRRDDAAGFAVEPELRVGVADLGDRAATTEGMSTHPLASVISPETNTTPVVTSVSQATRLLASCSSIASRTASLIWSASLSGWPSVTDSDEKR